MENIKWKTLDGYARYQISNSGLVKNIKTDKFVLGTISQGYICVTLYPDNGKQKAIRLHRIVATLFCPKKDNCNIVNHLDGNKTNNNAYNLEWTNTRENTKHAVTIGKILATNHRPVKRISPYTGEIKVYASITDAFQDNKDKLKYLSYIISVCSGRQSTSGGYIWEYVNDNIKDDSPIDGKEIKNYTNYLITKEGNVYSKKSQKYLNPTVNNAGYLIIDLQGDSYDTKNTSCYTRKRTAKRKKFRVHRLVAEYFIPISDSKNYEVNHKNKIRTDNRVENLEWVSSIENLRHAHNKIIYQFTLDWKLVYKYKSLNQASENTGIDYKNISYGVRKGYPRTAGQFYWTYTNPILITENGLNYIFIN